MKIIFYTTGCPKCKILKQKLDQNGLQYEVNTNVDEMIAAGLSSAPALSVDGETMGFSAACRWVDEHGNLPIN